MKYLFSLLALSIVGQVTAQEKFIEVTVSDTVLVEANTFVYRVTLSAIPLADYAVSHHLNYEQAMHLERRREMEALDSLIHALQQKGFVALPPSASDSFQTQSMSNRSTYRRILVHTIDSLSRLFQFVKKDLRFEGSVEKARASDESTAQKMLWEKVLVAGRQKATVLAAASGLHITGVLSVIDKAEEKAAGGWTSYPPLSALGDESSIPGWHTTFGPYAENVLVTGVSINTFYPINATFTIRFAVE